MKDHTITLSPQTYQRLLAIAQTQGVTPERWIDAQLPPKAPEPQPLMELLAGCVGAINSKEQPVHRPKRSAFGDAIAAKLAKQGIRRP
ncbi:MAG: hypothetical protein F6J87_22475 [Spirulina sp. SIO3F2]|nr:hypothetical protein [Spirulina sp. SIO3F2]